MKVTLLGTGTSTGVPSIGCECETCTSEDPRDKRLRVSALVEHEGLSVLIDTSSDFRQQALRHRIRRLDAVLITHCHADHIFGLDDIRPLNFRHGALGVYANERAWRDIRRIFQYVFEPSHFGGGLPQVLAHTVEHGASFCLGPGLTVTPVEVIHGRLPVAAYRLNDFAYLTDLSEIPHGSLELLRGLDALVLDCLRVRPHPTHLWLERSLEYVRELRPRRTFFTHMAHDILHARDCARLPPGVEFGYDGLEIEMVASSQ
ncbi:MAG TPA: MBL fold metallo-hydrolase [Pyrinomonadaceae bacterium]|nr:MBL fold metallo-hydrolase [Pyrinomonadaceae bacterium]